MALCRKHPEWVPMDAYDELCKGDVYEACPLEMKRRLWLHDHNLFGQYILPTVKEYIEDPAIRTMAGEMRGTDLAASSKERREHATVKKLTRLIGCNLQLYNVCLGLLRSLFIQDGQPMPCMLRFDLLMAMHDGDVREICDVDPCHKLVWSLDACIRTQQLDDRRVDEMRRFFESVKHRGVNEGVYGDLGIVLYDPFASNMIAGQLLQHLHAYAGRLGRVGDMKTDRTIQWASVVLNLGIHALHMIRQREFQIPRVPKSVTSGFFGVLVRVMAEDQRHSHRRWNGTDRPAGIGTEMEGIMRESVVAQMVFAHYILERVQRGDFLALSHALPSFVAALPATLPPCPLLDQLIQSLVTLVMHQHLSTLVAQEAVARLIIEEFLLKCVGRTVIVHDKTIRLIQAILWRVDVTVARTAYNWAVQCAQQGQKVLATDAQRQDTLRSECYAPIIDRSLSTPWRLTRENAPGIFNIVYGAAMDIES
ncbi:cofactor of BRCA1 [Syncephalis pseudoplumigaleata]|uniref:Cofactor of BRCA1 n=1 Tax=Syncephalis pseudoplumigaleata TaxID=1712513 RepID=A0A4P9YXS3_9FUNG|nr:cofactor of BRCA1 [Syncephalis pseudoplumigaleata]|eukprot:RKP24933.1 cofactor of BRCA1 [Syncephalis pseudoplumigaleata]